MITIKNGAWRLSEQQLKDKIVDIERGLKA